MNLEALFDGFSYEIVSGTPDKDVKSLIYHSDKARKGSAFFAINGEETNGQEYMERAAAKGAEVLITETFENETWILDNWTDITVIKVSDVRKALAIASNNFFNRPQDSLLVIGITGTKGKTTTSFMIKEIFEKAGIKTGIIGTVLTGCEGNYQEAENTTPQSYEIHRIFRDMLDKGCKAVVMEVSSQGLMHQRVYGIKFDVAIFTNISPDHIGEREHKSFEEYLYWKSRLFTQSKVDIINKDDCHWKYFGSQNHGGRLITFGTEGISRGTVTYIAKDISLWNDKDTLGVKYNIRGNEIFLGIPGEFNVSNSLAAVTAAREAGIDWEIIRQALKDIKVRGRVEKVPLGEEFTVLVDYAHNGVALESLLKTLRQYNPSRLIVVFGCGGNRDKNRRAEMGSAAARLADFSIITSDNPRNEEPMDIIKDIARAMAEFNGSYTIIPDRREAINWAVKEAMPEDIIVIAGKGHETYQIIGNEKRHFDDREVVLDAKEQISR